MTSPVTTRHRTGSAPGPVAPASPWDRGDGWLAAAAVTALAAGLRLPHLDRPLRLVFDETYYVKDAWTLLNLGYEGQWPEGPDPAFEAGDVNGYTAEPAYVVHPPVGKWLIALGLRALGAQDPVGWRIAAAIAGILAVLLLTRIARRLFGSTALGVVAGLLLALDGAAIVHSRVSVLDGFLMTFVLAAFGALLIDRDHARTRLARLSGPPRAPTRFGPALGLRPWRLVAGVLLGLALGTKWSALWFVAVFGLLSVGWDAVARRDAGVQRPWQAALLRDAVPAFVSLVPVAALTYVGSWASWLASSSAYGRTWAAEHPGEGVTWLPAALRSLWNYHVQMWAFHTGLTSEHAYASHPLGWVVQWRPTAFFYESPQPAELLCGADGCSQAVTSLGNPVIWWLGALALLACAWRVVRFRDGVAVAALSGVVAGWLPWFALTHRTIFAFYAVVFLPWLVLCLTWAGARLLAWSDADLVRQAVVRTLVVAAALLVVAATVFFLPLWTGEIIPLGSWQLRQLLDSWV